MTSLGLISLLFFIPTSAYFCHLLRPPQYLSFFLCSFLSAWKSFASVLDVNSWKSNLPPPPPCNLQQCSEKPPPFYFIDYIIDLRMDPYSLLSFWCIFSSTDFLINRKSFTHLLYSQVHYAASVGGSNLRDRVQRLLVRLMTNDLSGLYNYSGARSKAAFCLLVNLKEAIIGKLIIFIEIHTLKISII